MFTFFYEAPILVIFGFVALRLAGKKVMAEMTTLEMVTVLAIGTIIGHVASDSRLWQTLISIAIFVTVMFLFQIIALKFKRVERLFIGKPTLVIRDGHIVHGNLSKLRMTKEQLEMRCRLQGISDLSDIRTATIEVDGGIGFELTPSAKPLTRGQAEQILAFLRLELPPADEGKHGFFDDIRRTGG